MSFKKFLLFALLVLWVLLLTGCYLKDYDRSYTFGATDAQGNSAAIGVELKHRSLGDAKAIRPLPNP